MKSMIFALVSLLLQMAHAGPANTISFDGEYVVVGYDRTKRSSNSLTDGWISESTSSSGKKECSAGNDFKSWTSACIYLGKPVFINTKSCDPTLSSYVSGIFAYGIVILNGCADSFVEGIFSEVREHNVDYGAATKIEVEQIQYNNTTVVRARTFYISPDKRTFEEVQLKYTLKRK